MRRPWPARISRTIRHGRRSASDTCGIIFTTRWASRSSRVCGCFIGMRRRSGWRDSMARCGSTMPTLDRIAEKVRAGARVAPDEALALYREAPTALLGQLADHVRARKHPDNIVTYIIDRNVNYTNVCVAKCTFCAFYRDVGSPEG